MSVMANRDPLVGKGALVEGHRPWPRVVVTAETWRDAIGLLAVGERTLLGLWGERDSVHMALLDQAACIAVVSLACPDGHYPSVGETHAPAIRLERAIHDLVGLAPVGLADTRPWLDHGRWGAASRAESAAAYTFLPADGDSLHQIAVGPVHAGIIEPGHFRFTANGETIVRLEARLGYTHKGIARLMGGANMGRATRLAGRASGDSTVAYSLAFARAVEAATETEVPPRAVWLRATMAELERLANHFGDIGAICNDASFSLMHAHCAVLRERVLRFSAAAFGHRLMMDTIVPGGIAVDVTRESAAGLRALVDEIRAVFPRLINLYDNTASLQDRTVGTGHLPSELAQHFGAGGYIGRASGRGFDARRALPYPPYDKLNFEVPVLEEGDVNARVWIRIREVEQSLRLLADLTRPPSGQVRTDVNAQPGEGLALVEGFRGDILASVRLDADGQIEHCHLRDPSVFQWPLLEAVIEGNIVADFPLCNKSFNCSYSGHDM